MIKCNKKLELEYPDWHTMALNRYMKYDIFDNWYKSKNFEVTYTVNKLGSALRRQ